MYRHRFSPLILLAIGLTTALLFVGCDSAGPSGEEDPEDGESNEAPSAVADANNTTVNTGTEVTLDAASSEDPDGDELSYSWSLNTPDESTASLSDASAEQPTFTPDVAGDYVATVEVSDGTESSTDDVTVTAEAVKAVALSSNITTSRTFTPDTTYTVTSTICVENSSTLTIEDGVQVEFESGTGLKICGDGSAIVANGTASNGITFTGTTKQAGFWNGVGINSANINNELSGLTLEYAGGGELYTFIGSAAGLQLQNNSKVSLSNSTFRNNDAYGVQADEGVEFTGFSNNTFENNGTSSMNVRARNIGAMDTGTTYGSYVRVYNGSISNQTLTVAPIGVPYRISGVRPIKDGSDVTVEAGTVFEFEQDGGLNVTDNATAFKVKGTSSNNVTFTGTTKQAGFWNGVGINSTNTNNELSGLSLEYAGGGELYTFIGSAAGLQLQNNSKVSLSNSTFRNNDAYGVQADEGVEFTGFSNNTFENNGTSSMNVRARNIGAMDTGTTYGSYVRVYNGSISNQTLTVAPIGVPYRISGVRPIKDGSDVTVEAGTVFEFEQDSGLNVTGNATAFKAQGAKADSIVFTGTTKQAGFWSGIGFNSSNMTNELSYVKVEHGGGGELYTFIGDAANIQVRTNARITLENSLIKNSAAYGVYADDGASAVSESNNTYQGNADGGTNY